MTTDAARAPALERARQGERSTVVVVVGAGRSGTSVLTRGIQALGVDLGDRLRPPGGKNPTGFFEDQDLLALNQRLKRALGIRGHSVRLLDAGAWETPAVQALRRDAVETIRRRFGRSLLWGFKYGRTLRMLPFWEAVFQELELDVRYAVALRNPLSVARSRAVLHPERGRQAWSDLEWLVNVVPYFHELRARPFVVVDFDALLGAPAAGLERAAGALGLPLDDRQRHGVEDYARSFLRQGMRHSQFRPEDLALDPHSHPLLRRAYSWLHRLAHDEVSAGDEMLWRDWARIQDRLNELAPLLREMDWLRGQLDAARWNPFTPVHALRQLWRDWRSR